jgi:hypothetical protein
MIRTSVCLSVCLLLICCALPVMAQRAASAESVVPAMVKFTGTLSDADGKPLTGTVGATFLLYKEQAGGAPLWMETQNVQADKSGRYSVMLGSATSHGMPAEAFAAGEARWLGVQPSGQAEQPRVVLVSVPYALKALDAETLGGRPASAFMAAQPSGSKGNPLGPQAEQPNEIVCSSSSACKSGFVPLFSTNGGSAKVSDSIVTQSGTTVKIAGTETTTGTISSGGDLDANGNVNANGSVSASGSVNASGSVSASSVFGTLLTALGTSSGGSSVLGLASSGAGSFAAGVNGTLTSGDPTYSYGVYGENDSVTGGKGVFGFNKQGAGGVGVQGYAPGTNAIGVAGSSNTFGTVAHSLIGNVPLGVLGDSSSGYGIAATSDNSNALLAENHSTADTLVTVNNGGGAPFYAQGTGGYGFVDQNGNLVLTGVVFAAAKDFKIDHPLDPANKYLYHASIESSEMKNIYDGIAVLDGSGSARVELPEWFEAVNGDFRYQLTALGAPGPNLHIAQKISNNQFTIAGGQPGMEVSWLVTGVRHDAYAQAHPLQVSVDKSEGERGYYIHPELYGASAEKSLASAHRAQFPKLANPK